MSQVRMTIDGLEPQVSPWVVTAEVKDSWDSYPPRKFKNDSALIAFFGEMPACEVQLETHDQRKGSHALPGEAAALKQYLDTSRFLELKSSDVDSAALWTWWWGKADG